MEMFDPGQEAHYLNNNIGGEKLIISPDGKLVVENIAYEKYNTNLNERPDYECERKLYELCWLHYTAIPIELIFISILICIPDFEKIKYDNVIRAIIILVIITVVVFGMLPYSIRYRISFTNRQMTYQYIPFIPHTLICKTPLNIEDAVYFREDMTQTTSGCIGISKYKIRVMKKK